MILSLSCSRKVEYNEKQLIGTWRMDEYNDGSRFPNSREEMFVGYYKFEKNKKVSVNIMGLCEGLYKIRNNKLFIKAVYLDNKEIELNLSFEILSIKKNQLVFGNVQKQILTFTPYNPKDTSKFEKIISDPNIEEVIFENVRSPSARFESL